jgi:hypothetical protein
MQEMKFALAAGAAIVALAIATSGQAANLVLNGDFEAGNVIFGSDYTFVVDTHPPGVYTVDDDPNDGHEAFTSFGDHTTGTGQMMIVNGSEVEGLRVWYENGLVVVPNTTYFFSTWIASAHPAAPAQLDFSINGAAIGPTFTAPATTGVWQQFFASWNSGSNTTADIALVNRNLAFSGNDFTLDDISLSTISPQAVPEPAAWALMILGFGATGAMLRRRREGVLAA